MTHKSGTASAQRQNALATGPVSESRTKMGAKAIAQPPARRQRKATRFMEARIIASHDVRNALDGDPPRLRDRSLRQRARGERDAGRLCPAAPPRDHRARMRHRLRDPPGLHAGRQAGAGRDAPLRVVLVHRGRCYPFHDRDPHGVREPRGHLRHAGPRGRRRSTDRAARSPAHRRSLRARDRHADGVAHARAAWNARHGAHRDDALRGAGPRERRPPAAVAGRARDAGDRAPHGPRPHRDGGGDAALGHPDVRGRIEVSKAFTREDAPDDGEFDDGEEQNPIPAGSKNYMTPHGWRRMRDELTWLVKTDRPEVTSVVSWAAKLGDRSENADYQYGKKRLREIDRRIRYLTKRLEAAEVVDPATRESTDQVFFGATVEYVDGAGATHTVRIVGLDEMDPSKNYVSWISPVARALIKAREGDTVTLRTPGGDEQIEIVEVRYEEIPMPKFQPTESIWRPNAR